MGGFKGAVERINEGSWTYMSAWANLKVWEIAGDLLGSDQASWGHSSVLRRWQMGEGHVDRTSVQDSTWSALPSTRSAYRWFVEIAQAVRPSRLIGAGWKTSTTKLLDNAVVAYCSLNDIRSRGG